MKPAFRLISAFCVQLYDANVERVGASANPEVAPPWRCERQLLGKATHLEMKTVWLVVSQTSRTALEKPAEASGSGRSWMETYHHSDITTAISFGIYHDHWLSTDCTTEDLHLFGTVRQTLHPVLRGASPEWIEVSNSDPSIRSPCKLQRARGGSL